MDWLETADAINPEVTTTHPLGVGYKLGVAEKLSKPALCLNEDRSENRKLRAMISGNPNLNAYLYHDLNQAKEGIIDYLNSIT